MPSCLVNPLACFETELKLVPATNVNELAGIGAGPAGLAFATSAAERGHEVTLFDAADEVGGQFNVAKQVPGKEEFYETIRYFSRRIQQTGVNLQLNTKVDVAQLNDGDYDEVVLATGISPRVPPIPGIESDKVLGYLDVLTAKKPVGKKVAVIGAGGIGFDVSEYLSHEGEATSQNIEAFMKEWGVDMTLQARGGIEGVEAQVPDSPREVFLLQRKESKVGGGLGKTTGWIHRTGLINKGVKMIPGCEYLKIDTDGLHIRVGDHTRVLDVDNIILCAGQESKRDLVDGLKKPHHLIGGADLASELDAKRAIDQGTRLAAEI